jgi:tRNA/tmRNA/rRNA uracil-C5-methylase (TrmA/RlmC/RlmD family)
MAKTNRPPRDGGRPRRPDERGPGGRTPGGRRPGDGDARTPARGPRPGERAELAITDIAADGAGVGNIGRLPVRVPFTIPGERALVEITAVPADPAHALPAEGVRLLAASGDRVMPTCAVFGPRGCVRCAWQHMNEAAQRALKADIVLTELERVGLRDVVVRPTLESAETWGYLWHSTFSLVSLDPASDSPPPVQTPEPAAPDSDDAADDAADSDSDADDAPDGDADDADDEEAVPDGPGARLALSARGGGVTLHDDQPFAECALLHPDLLDLIDLLDLGALDAAAAQIARVRLARGSDGGRAITLYLRAETAPSLVLDQPVSVNVLLSDNTPMNLIGDAHLTMTARAGALERHFRVTTGSFYRATAAMVGPLAAAVLDALAITPADRVLDVYAGVGVFAAFAAERAGLVTAIESYPPAATDCDVNTAGFAHVTVIEGAAADVLDALAEDGETYTAAILDLPGGRFEPDLPAQMIDLDVRRVALIADQAVGFAFAARAFHRAGYRLRFAQPVETMPHTHYMEIWGVFEREGR